MKKVLALILAVAMIASVAMLTACGNNANKVDIFCFRIISTMIQIKMVPLNGLWTLFQRIIRILQHASSFQKKPRSNCSKIYQFQVSAKIFCSVTTQIPFAVVSQIYSTKSIEINPSLERTILRIILEKTFSIKKQSCQTPGLQLCSLLFLLY